MVSCALPRAETQRRIGTRAEVIAADGALDRVWMGERAWLRMDRL